MVEIPAAELVAELVSSVTSAMFGLSFIAAADQSRSPALCWKVAVLPTVGSVPLSVALSTNEQTCAHLGATMFGCELSEVTTEDLDDALCELLNMTAGKIKFKMAPDQALGLPQLVEGADFFQKASNGMWTSFVLKSDSFQLLVSVSDKEDLHKELTS